MSEAAKPPGKVAKFPTASRKVNKPFELASLLKELTASRNPQSSPGEPKQPDPSKQKRDAFHTKDSKTLRVVLSRLQLEIRYNILSHGVEYRSNASEKPTWLEITDLMEDALKEHISKKFKLITKAGLVPLEFSREKWQQNINAICFVTQVNPVTDWIKELPEWDGKERIAKLLHKTFGAAESKYIEWISTAMWVGVLERSLTPGNHMRQVPVLIGPQACGKSRFIEYMLPEHLRCYYNSALDLSGNKQQRVESIRGMVLVECAEMHGAKRAKIEAIKAFLSPGADRLRMSYRRNPETIKRNCFIIGTANPEGGPLPNDLTGNTRFNAVGLKRGAPVEKRLDAIRDQAWAEALHLYKLGARVSVLPRKFSREQSRSNKEYEWDDANVMNLVSTLKASDGPATAIELAVICDYVKLEPGFGTAEFPKRFKNRSEAQQFTAGLRRAGWISKKSGGKQTWKKLET